MADTQKVVAILITLISSIISCIQLNIAMLNSQRDYLKKKNGHRSSSFVANSTNGHRETTRQEG